MKKQLERGCASLIVELYKGEIVMRHGTHNNVLHRRECPQGDWDKLVNFLKGKKS